MNPLYIPIFFIIAIVYSAPGLGGGTAYLATLSLLDIPYSKIPPLALFLNILCATIAFYNYQKAGHFKMNLLIPFVVSSVPTTLLGSQIQLTERIFYFILGIVLFLVSIRLLLFHNPAKRSIFTSTVSFWSIGLLSGGVIGLLGGIIGIGGGVFLTPLLLFLRWADPKQSATLSSAFIVLNSLSGFVGHTFKASVDLSLCLPLGLAVILGSYTGSWLGVRKLSPVIIQKIFAMLLIIVVWRLIGRVL